jgi:hypothetical protein
MRRGNPVLAVAVAAPCVEKKGIMKPNRLWWLMWSLACVPQPGEPDPETPSVTIQDLWSGQTGRQTLEAVVTSPRSTTGTHFYVQAEGGGLHSGLRVQLDGFLEGVPPAKGTPIEITGDVTWGDGLPHLKLSRFGDLEVTGEALEPAAPPWTEEDSDALRGALVETSTLTVTSRPDPGGTADTDAGFTLAGAFGFTPEWSNTGSLTGVVTGAREISLRGPGDWRGPNERWPTIDTEIADLRDTDWQPGTPIRFYATQATPWSFDGRWVVVQDEEGRGVWLDAEGWNITVDSMEGDTGWWEGEVRDHTVEGRYIRTWLSPEITSSRAVVEVQEWTDGALWSQPVYGMASDALDGRTGDGVTLDGRLTPLEPLPDGTWVTGALRQGEPDALAVFKWVPPLPSAPLP